MSGMFDKKTEKVKRKQELTAKEQKERQRRRIITISVTVVFLLLVGVAVLINSNWMRRTVPVVTVNGIGFSAAQFEFFYNSEYMNLASEMQAQGWDFMLPDSSRPLSGQLYDEQTGETWADFFVERAISSIQEVSSLYTLAQADGFTLDEEQYSDVEYALWMSEYQAMSSGFPSAESYLQRLYGVGMTVEIYRELLEMITLTEAYIEHVRENLRYTQEEISRYYASKADEFDIFRYRVFTVTAEYMEDADEAGAALAEAMQEAEAIAAGIESEDDFIASAREYDGELYADDSSTFREAQGIGLDASYAMDPYLAGWLKESGRANGETTVVELPEGAAVAFFIERDDNSYKTVSMRQILITRESVPAADFENGEDDPAYIEAVKAAEDEARERAELVDRLFTEAGRTEQAFLDLIEEHSDDTTEGGFYEDIVKYPYQGGGGIYAMKVVPELEEWLFEDGRNVGESLLIETEAYGFHLLYFAGFGEVFADLMAEDRMRTEDTNAWLEGIDRGEPVKHGAFILVTT